uniref:Uncharacterized protein LOC104218238 n=1 Tax=Nicotiana sylvestris TaxID=4096 RepID=A0A1U7VPV6_NICSY|nr:PREDICTED: uncharacterized protein LOC104218238 [Nicotiana sylvestris]
MPSYTKFMKDLVTKKRSINFETIKVTHQVSAIVQSMVPKLEDPGAFTIPCTIGSVEFSKALYNLGASINLMPYSFFKTLEIRQPRPTSTRLQMADRTMKKPLGVIEDVLVRADKFIPPTDFVILDCEVDYEVPIILGRSFLATGKALCDVEDRELTFRVGDEQVVFHVCKSMRQPNNNELCSFVDLVTDVIVDNTRMGSYNYAPQKLYLDLENRTTLPIKPSIEEPPSLELKSLSAHLRACGFYIGGATKEEEGYWVDAGGYSGDKPSILQA